MTLAILGKRAYGARDARMAIYQWSCHGRRDVPGKTTTRLDARGFVADAWKEIR